jgi:hypothetical protein
MANLRDTLEEVKGILLVIVAILGALAALFEKLKVLKPLIVCVLFLATVIVPAGSMAWFFTYLAAENSNRIKEPVVFLSLVAQSTAAVSLYAFFWGMWLYPRLKPWFRNQVRSVPQPSEEGQAQEGEGKEEPTAQQSSQRSQPEDDNQLDSTPSLSNEGGES